MPPRGPLRRFRLRACSLVGAALLAAACSGEDPRCLVSADCDGFSRCVDGVCQPPASCRAATDCPAPPSCASVSCIDGSCRAIGDDALCGPGARCDIGRGCIRPPGEDGGVRDACAPMDERCDGMDQDCDGRVDEGGGLCFLPRAEGTCASGRCEVASCAPGFANCNARADDGCEAPLGEAASCGACGVRCEGATPFCAVVSGSARCVDACPPDASTDCGGACVDLATSPVHCGGCGAPCDPPSATGVCVGGACTIGACAPGRGDCDSSVGTGCETSLATTTDCGACGAACDAPSGACEVLPASCVGGACRYSAAPAATVCRPAVDACDVAETCGGATTCPDDALAPSGAVCRAPTCATDPGEECSGAAASCPAACGCHGEPCCAGDACASGLSCRAGACRMCRTSTPSVSGTFETADTCDKGGCYSSSLRSVSASGATLTFTDSWSRSATLTLGGGVTASGSFTTTYDCPDACYHATVRSATASGSTLRFFDSSGGSGTITFTGATISGSFTATMVCDEYCYWLPLRRITGSGATITFTDTSSAASPFTLTASEICS